MFPFSHKIAEGTSGGVPVARVFELFGAGDNVLFEFSGSGAAPIKFGEVRSAPPVEGIACPRVAFPQHIIGFAIHATDGFPFLENLAESVTGAFPVLRGLPNLFCLFDKGFFACCGFHAALRTISLDFLVG